MVGMADIWLPGYTRVDLGWSGAPYDETAHPKLLWHTTEGGSIAGARAAFRSYPPHGCYDPWTDEAEQYVPLNRHAYALAGGESDDEYVIQWEIVGRAAESHTWPEHVLERLGRRVAAPIAATVGVPPQYLPFRRADEGIVLARSTSPIRLSSAAFREYSGHLGHQHAPSPDTHWDPGGLPIDRILTYAQGDDDMLTDPQIAALLDAANAVRPGQVGERHDGVLWREVAGISASVTVVQAALGQILAAVTDGPVDAEQLVERLRAEVRTATEQAVATTLLPAIDQLRAALAEDDTDTAKAVVDELVTRLRPSV